MARKERGVTGVARMLVVDDVVGAGAVEEVIDFVDVVAGLDEDGPESPERRFDLLIGTIELTTSPRSISDVTSRRRRSSSVTPFSLRRRTTRLPSISARSHSFGLIDVIALDHKVAK